MSRSHQKIHKDGVFLSFVSYKSNKPGKKAAHRSFRSKVRTELFRELCGEVSNIPNLLREVYDVYDFPSDGLKTFRTRDRFRSSGRWLRRLSDEEIEEIFTKANRK